jgi:hypothetical protein
MQGRGAWPGTSSYLKPLALPPRVSAPPAPPPAAPTPELLAAADSVEVRGIFTLTQDPHLLLTFFAMPFKVDAADEARRGLAKPRQHVLFKRYATGADAHTSARGAPCTPRLRGLRSG